MKKLLILLLFVVTAPATLVHAQNRFDHSDEIDPGTPPPPPIDPVDTPIDGGLSILVSMGVGYGIKKAVANRSKKSVTQSAG